MTKYAVGTDVPESRSRQEIETVLKKFGASSFAYGWQGGSAIIAFEAAGRHIRFTLPLPEDPKGKETTERRHRERWRALVLAIKSKLVTVDTGISSFENEFMAYIVLPNGMNVSEWLSPQIKEAYERGGMPDILLLGPGKK